MPVQPHKTMAQSHWWVRDPAERFWLEATDRADIGADLRAPVTDASGRDNWRYSLLKEARIGDVVLHYNKNPAVGGIVGWSRIAAPPHDAPIVWAARGTFARARGDDPVSRPGFLIPLSDFHQLPRALTLEVLRKSAPTMRQLVDDMHARHGPKTSLYFPFDVSGVRDLRLLQGYGFKLPKHFLDMFSELSSVPRDGPLPLAAEDADTNAFDPRGIDDARERVTRGIKIRRGQKNFRDALLAAYDGRCAITGCDIQDVLEAAHITPYLGPETNHVTNGLLLRTDLHTLLDCHLLGIEPATKRVLLAPSLRTSVDYGHLHGQSLRCASPVSDSPSIKALEAAALRLAWMSETVDEQQTTRRGHARVS
ncbi:putative RNA-binding protein with PUA-like domain [Paraburkholderia sp. GAS33]